MTPPPEFTQSPTKPFNIAVVGGGIAGLTLTLALLKQRIPVILYEAAHQFGEIGAGVSFGPNAQRAMKLISPHIYDGFENVATHNQWPSKGEMWFDFRYGESCEGRRNVGDRIYTLECENGNSAVHRAHFLDEMVKLLPDGIARFNKRLVDFTQDEKGVLLRFQDGTEARHDALVGTDGIKSKCRQILLGENDKAAKAVFSGKIAYRGLIPIDKAVELLGEEYAKNSQMYLGLHGHVLTFCIEKGKTMNVVAFYTRESWGADDWVVQAQRERMYKDFEGWGDSVKNILGLMKKTDIWALFKHLPCDTYFKGRASLLGDAAHASTPHMGAGAGMAIEDAYILSNLLGQLNDSSEIENAFRAYDLVRRPRTQRLVEASSQQGRLYDLELAGDAPSTTAKELATRVRWVWEHDLRKELGDAKRLLSIQAHL